MATTNYLICIAHAISCTDSRFSRLCPSSPTCAQAAGRRRLARLTQQRNIVVVQKSSSRIVTIGTDIEVAAVCPACGSSSLEAWGRDADKTILMCSKCRSTSFPRPIQQSHDYGTYYPYLQYMDHERYRRELDYRRRGFNLQLEEIERLDPPGRTLVDFGAGVAYFCAIAQERGWKATAVDVSPEAIAVGGRELGVDYVDLANVADHSCSVITAFHVLEHVEAPSDLVRLFHEKLVPGGILVVHVPNFESLAAYLHYRLRRLIRGSDQRRGSLYYPEHVTGFSRAGLEHCVAAGGFDVLSLRQCSFFSHDHLPVTLDLLTGGPPRRSVPALARRCMMGMIDNVGHLVGKGDWIVGHCRKRA